jgi:hypothetical protein
MMAGVPKKDSKLFHYAKSIAAISPPNILRSDRLALIITDSGRKFTKP